MPTVSSYPEPVTALGPDDVVLAEQGGVTVSVTFSQLAATLVPMIPSGDQQIRVDLDYNGGKLVSWVRAVAGAYKRSLTDLFDDELSVMDFIPFLERQKIRLRISTADVSYAFAAAEVAAVARGGGLIKVPGGKYRAFRDSLASNIHWAGDGSAGTTVQLPDAAQHTITVNGGPGTTTVTPCVFAFGQIGDGNAAVASSGNRISGMTIDGNAAGGATAVPDTDLGGWGIACTKHAHVDLTDDVVVRNCHAGGIGVFIDSNHYRVRAKIIDCGNSTSGGLPHEPGFDNNSSKYGVSDVIVIGGVYASRILDNAWTCRHRVIAINPQLQALILNNQTVNVSYGIDAEVLVYGGCGDYAVTVGAKFQSSKVKLRAYGITGVGLREIGAGLIASQYRATDMTYDAKTSNSGHGSAVIEGNGADLKVSSNFDGRATGQGDEFAVQISGPDVSLDAKVFDAADGSWKIRGVIFHPGATRTSYRIKYTGGGNALDDQSEVFDHTGYGSRYYIPWIEPTLGAGITNALDASFASCGYILDEYGIVRLRGQLTGTAGTAFTLPVGYRPTSKMVFGDYAGGQYVVVDEDGSVTLVGTGSTWVLNGITFSNYH